MQPRIDYKNVSHGALNAMMEQERYLHQCGLDKTLLNLVRLRVSQINGCAFCIDMHAKDLRAAGETEQRVYGLDAWDESPFYSSKERAALRWAEVVTRLNEHHVSDEEFKAVKTEFEERELVDLTLAIVAINGWNRLNISFRTVPGAYQAGQIEQLISRQLRAA